MHIATEMLHPCYGYTPLFSVDLAANAKLLAHQIWITNGTLHLPCYLPVEE
jgi:hypothetical protein